MKRLVPLALAFLALASGGFAQRKPPVHRKTIHRKVTAKKTHPVGATALCRDGTYSYARHHQGACSWHGGVREWYK